MITPSQILPFLEHKEAVVRGFAATYLAEAHDPSPATADDVWRAINRLSEDDASDLLAALAALPQSEASVRRLIDRLAKAKALLIFEDDVQALLKTPLPLLLPVMPEIREIMEFPRVAMAYLELRQELAALPPDELWEQMAAQAQDRWDTQDDDDSDEDRQGLDENERGQALVEAVSRFPERFAERILQGLNDSSINGWLEVYLITLAGLMRLEGAIDVLVQKMNNEEGDASVDEAENALVRIGTPQVVSAVADFYLEGCWSFHISGATVLGKIKRPESLQAVLCLLPDADEEDDSLTFLSKALCDLVPTEAQALETMADIVKSVRYDETILDLTHDAYAVATMVGYQVPELAHWRQSIEEEEREEQSGETEWEQHDGTILEREFPKFAPKHSSGEPQTSSTDSDSPGRYDSVTAPIRRTTPKVGRNDPCPCGSGKKYKKCCGGSA